VARPWRGCWRGRSRARARDSAGGTGTGQPPARTARGKRRRVRSPRRRGGSWWGGPIRAERRGALVREAAEALDVAERLGLPEPVARAADLLVYQVLLRDGRPSPIWCAPCSCRSEPPAAGRDRCWPPWLPIRPWRVAAAQRRPASVGRAVTYRLPGSGT